MSATRSARVPVLDSPGVAIWIATSWYMAVTVIFFAMVLSEDTEARLDMLRRGLIVGRADRRGRRRSPAISISCPAATTC